jgi:hypothetical protein
MAGGGRCLVWWGLHTRERAKEGGVSVVMAEGAPHPFIGAGRRGAAGGGRETGISNGLNAIEGRAA